MPCPPLPGKPTSWCTFWIRSCRSPRSLLVRKGGPLDTCWRGGRVSVGWSVHTREARSSRGPWLCGAVSLAVTPSHPPGCSVSPGHQQLTQPVGGVGCSSAWPPPFSTSALFLLSQKEYQGLHPRKAVGAQCQLAGADARGSGHSIWGTRSGLGRKTVGGWDDTCIHFIL